MTTHPVELVYQSLTHIVTPYMSAPESVQGECSCCKRPVEEFGALGYTLKNSYNQSVMHCLACQSFYVSAPAILGVESPKNPAKSQKFGMWPGVGALINIQDLSAVLLAPPGVVNKFPPAFFDKVNVITATVGEQFEYLFDANLQYPLIYIQDFGRKTYELIRSLRISHSGDAVYCCRDMLMTRTNEIAFITNLDNAKALFKKMMAYNRSEISAFIRTVELLAHGHISPIEASGEFKKNNVTSLVRMLPADPHQRINLMRSLKKVL